MNKILKKHVVKIIIFLSIFATLYGNKFQYGVSTAVNHSKYKEDRIKVTDSIIGIEIGGFCSYLIQQKIRIQAEISVSMRGAKAAGKVKRCFPDLDNDEQFLTLIDTLINQEEESNEDYLLLFLDDFQAYREMRYMYFDFSLLGNFSWKENLSFVIGPSLGIFLGGNTQYSLILDNVTKMKRNNTRMDSDDITKPALSLTLGVDYSIDPIKINTRYSLGLMNFPEASNGLKLRNSSFSMGLSYRLK